MVDTPFVCMTTGTTPFSGFSKAKRILYQDVFAARPETDAHAELTSGSTLHDLYLTATTGMALLGIHPRVADALLNHKYGTIRGVAAVYNRHAYIDERHRALEAWDRRERSQSRPSQADSSWMK